MSVSKLGIDRTCKSTFFQSLQTICLIRRCLLDFIHMLPLPVREERGVFDIGPSLGCGTETNTAGRFVSDWK